MAVLPRSSTEGTCNEPQAGMNRAGSAMARKSQRRSYRIFKEIARVQRSNSAQGGCAWVVKPALCVSQTRSYEWGGWHECYIVVCCYFDE